jgi:uncharacterized protein
LFYKRAIFKALERYTKFPVIAILGPRQSGKTTLAKRHFKDYAYVNLENPEFRSFAKEDPNRFLKEFENKKGLIIDEFQYVPELLSYIQVAVDEKKRAGYFVLTGSQNFIMNEAITQSLAGRIGILTLLPLSLSELEANKLLDGVDSVLFSGSYPRVYEEEISPIDFYPSYIHTYLEGDVRQMSHVGDILVFQKFMRLVAARIGQLLNLTEMATQLGIDVRKVNQWLSVLETSYIIFLLKPHFQNFTKRLTKTPKLYFYDTGLACALLDIKTKETLALSSYRGSLFESLIIADFQKQYYNAGMSSPSTYFWRDQNGRIEVDCLIDRGDALFPIEIKSGETISPSFFTALTAWGELAKEQAKEPVVIYGGDKDQSRSKARVFSWKSSSQFIENLYH